MFWKGSLKSIHSEYESLKPAEDTEQGRMEQVTDDRTLVTVAVSSEITENSEAVPPTSTKPETVNSAGYIPDFTQIDSSHVLKYQIYATKEQEQAMLATDTHTVSSPYLDEQSLLANQENNNTHALSTQENNDQVSSDSTFVEFHDASSLASVVASFSPDTTEQQSSNSTPPGYVNPDYNPQPLNYQTQITGEPHSISFDIELEEDTHLECTEGLVYNVTNSTVDESVAGEIKTHDTLGMHVTSIHMTNKMSFHSSPIYSGYIDYSEPVLIPNAD